MECFFKYSFNYATWESAVHGFSSIKNLAMVRKQLFNNRLVKPGKMFSKRYLSLKSDVRIADRIISFFTQRSNMLGYFYDQFLEKYAVDFLGSDKSVVERTQKMNYDLFKTKSVKIHCYHQRKCLFFLYIIYVSLNKFQYAPFMTVNSLFSVLKIFIYGFMFMTLSKFSFGRYLLLKVIQLTESSFWMSGYYF